MKENFDDIIRRRWEAQQFPVDEQHRQDMARLLEGEKKRRGFVFWWYGGAAVALLLAAALWKFNSPSAVDMPRTENTESTEKYNEVQAKAKVENEVVLSKPNESLSGVAEVKAKAKAKDEEELKSGSSNTNQNVKTKSAPGSNKTKPGKVVADENQNGQTDSKLKPRTESAKETENVISNNESPIDPLQGGEGEAAGGGKSGSEIPTGGYKVELENPNQVAIVSEVAPIRVFPDSIEYDPWINAIYYNGTVRSLNKTKALEPLAIQEVKSMDSNAPGMIKPHTKLTHPLYLMAETGLGFVLA
jgi:hypothetical protein